MGVTPNNIVYEYLALKWILPDKFLRRKDRYDNEKKLNVIFMVFIMVTLWSLGCDNSVEVELNENQSKPQAKLRSSYKGLSVRHVQSIPHISIREKRIGVFGDTVQ